MAHASFKRRHNVTLTSGDYSYSPSSVGAAAQSAQTMTVKGIRLNDTYTLNLPSTGTGSITLLLTHHYISAADTITMVFFNTDVGAHTPSTPTAADPYVVSVN